MVRSVVKTEDEVESDDERVKDVFRFHAKLQEWGSARIVMIYPEDGGGNILSGPCSSWCLNEFSMLDGWNDAKRGPGFSRQLAKADQQLPLGTFSILTSLQKEMSSGWPQFSQAEGVLSYIGPLLGPCPCEVPHSNSSEAMSLGIGFWRRCFASLWVQVEPIPVTDGKYVGLGSSFFLPSEADPWHQLYSSWSTGGLTRTFSVPTLRKNLSANIFHHR